MSRLLKRIHTLIKSTNYLRSASTSPIRYVRTAPTIAAATPNAFRDPPEGRQRIKLRGYQEECIQSILAYLRDGSRRLGVSLATGSGKTVFKAEIDIYVAPLTFVKVIFTQLIDRVTPPNELATRTLILAHRQELVTQAADHCMRVYPEKDIEIELGNLHAKGTADITVASVQSITSGERIQKFDPRRYKLILVDEAHHIVSPTYLKVLEHFGLRPHKKVAPALVGVSATFSRFDGLKLGTAIDHIVYHKDYVDMIHEKWLCKIIFTTVKTNANLYRVRKQKTGDFQLSSLSEEVNTKETNELVVRAWMAKALERKSTLVFCVDLEHVFGLTATFRRFGIDSRFVTGDTPKKERSDTLEAFKNREFPVLLNCGVFTEGTDVPNIDCVVLARPTRSRNLLVQMIGRGMRLYTGKENCHVIDFVASLETGIVSTPTLFGLDPDELVDEATPEDMQTRKEQREHEERVKKGLNDARSIIGPVKTSADLTQVTFTDYDSVDDLIEDTSGERHIRGLSPHAWVQVGDNRFILSAQNGDYLQVRLDDEKQQWMVFYTQKIPASAGIKAPYMKPRIIATSDLFEHGLSAADTFAAEQFPHNFISKMASWRHFPASDAQLRFLNRIRGENNKLKEGQISKGRATDMITKIKFGARGRYQRQVSRGRAKKKAGEKARKMREREEVRVGPLSDT